MSYSIPYYPGKEGRVEKKTTTKQQKTLTKTVYNIKTPAGKHGACVATRAPNRMPNISLIDSGHHSN
jgi:hypothetical protein